MKSTNLSRWRQVQESIIREIDRGKFRPGAQLPTHIDLARRFGVNPHTVRRALHGLQGDGLIRIEQGRGIFVADDVISYRLGAHTRFIENISDLGRIPGHRLVGKGEMLPTADIAQRLGIGRDEGLIYVTLLGEADAVPILVSTIYCRKSLVPGLSDILDRETTKTYSEFSFTEALKSIGIPKYQRTELSISSRPATPEEAHLLKMPKGGHVLEADSIHVDPEKRKLLYGNARFCSSRVRLTIEVDISSGTEITHAARRFF